MPALPNADFIPADGSYRSLVPRLAGDARIVLAPSYCIIAEEVPPLLPERLGQATQTLAIPPRENERYRGGRALSSARRLEVSREDDERGQGSTS